MDIQFHGGNCISVTYKGTRLVIDDNLAELGAKSVSKPDDVALFTGVKHDQSVARLTFDGPGEYEVSDISIVGIAARAHIDAEGKNANILKLVAGDLSVLITGHVFPDLNEEQLEDIGRVHVMLVPVGGNGYTVDPAGALKLIKEVEPKLVVPTHYDDKALKFPVPQQNLEQAVKELGMEPKETVSKLKLKAGELADLTQLTILEKS